MSTEGIISSKRQFFLFPLEGVVFFPHTTKPLNVFEPRYVKMINDALLTDTPVVLAKADAVDESGEGRREPWRFPGSRETGVLGHVNRVAGAGRVRLLERRPDETMLILLEGDGKVLLDRVVPREEPYYTVMGSWLEDSAQLEEENIFLLNRAIKELGRWLSIHVPDPMQRDAFLSLLISPEEKINTLCALMIADADLQQEFLEIDDINERLQAVCFYLFETVPTA